MKMPGKPSRFAPLLLGFLLLCSPVVLWAMGLDWGTPPPTPDLIISPGAMKAPLRIATTVDGRLLVSDYQARAIMQIAPTAPDLPEVLFKVEGMPLAVEAIRNFILVGDDTARTLNAYKYDGNLMKVFAVNGPVQASDMAYDPGTREVFVADSLNRDIKVFKDSGEFKRSFGVTGPLYDPKGVALDPQSQQIFVTDYGDPVQGIPASIQIFDYQGELLRKINGNFSRPQGIAVDTSRIFLVDTMLSQILVFDRISFEFVTTIGTRGVEEGQLLLPMDVYLDAANGRLVVTNSRLGKLTSLSLVAP